MDSAAFAQYNQQLKNEEDTRNKETKNDQQEEAEKLRGLTVNYVDDAQEQSQQQKDTKSDQVNTENKAMPQADQKPDNHQLEGKFFIPLFETFSY